MKNITVCIILVSIWILTLCVQCEEKYPIYLINNASHSIGFYFATGGKYGTYYPDSLPENDHYINYNLSPKEEFIYDSGISWEEIFKNNFPRDTLSVFIFHSDTLKRYSWEEIRDGYKILKRYDLSLDDLKQRNWIITFPE